MNDESYKNFIELLKLFKNRPYHLAKYLVENGALDKTFIDNLSKSEKLNNIVNSELNPKLDFISISQMEDFYLSLLDIKDIKGKTAEEVEKELNEKLDILIRAEKYEDAARLRDYMQGIKIKRINKF
jgi:hypothetical protein